MKTVLALILIFLCTMAMGCAAPAAAPGGTEKAAARQSTAAPVRKAPPMSSPLPPREMKPTAQLDYSCRSSADCAVKDVGNCCGSMPACVNKGSQPDPAAVRAQCQASGRMDVCGFQEISACQCVSGRCEAEQSAPLGAQ